jgi:hypothetical protein
MEKRRRNLEDEPLPPERDERYLGEAEEELPKRQGDVPKRRGEPQEESEEDSEED